MGTSCVKPTDCHIFLIQDMKIKTTKVLAQGGYGFVYLSQDLKTKKKYALKVVQLPNHQQRLIFQREIEAMRLFGQHPNIIQMRSAEQKEQYGFILMEKAKYTLWQKIHTTILNPIPEEEIIYILREISQGLKHIHSKGYAHRDIKSQNILLLPDGRITICDFGSCTNDFMNSKLISQQEKLIYQEQYGKYTTGIYKPPELIDLTLGWRIDQKMDMWMLGCLLYVMCYYKAPWKGEKDEIVEKKVRIPEGGRVGKQMVELIEWLMKKNPQERPTASEVIKYLDGVWGNKSRMSDSARGSGGSKGSGSTNSR